MIDLYNLSFISEGGLRGGGGLLTFFPWKGRAWWLISEESEEGYLREKEGYLRETA